MKITNYGIIFRVTGKYSVTYCAPSDVMRHIIFDEIIKHLSIEVLRHGSLVGRCSVGIQDDCKIIDFLIGTMMSEALRED